MPGKESITVVPVLTRGLLPSSPKVQLWGSQAESHGWASVHPEPPEITHAIVCAHEHFPERSAAFISVERSATSLTDLFNPDTELKITFA